MNGKRILGMEKYKKMLGRMDRQKWVVCILLGVLLMVIAIPVESKGDEEETEDEVETEKCSTDYEREMEERVEEILSQVEGVGEVKVMITLEDEGESIVEKDDTKETLSREQGEETTEESSTQSSTVFMGEKPYETKLISPKIRGICVVAQGAKKNETRVKIYQSIQALFGVEAHKISIVEMGMQEET